MKAPGPCLMLRAMPQNGAGALDARTPRSVAVLGAGPVGSSLAAYLARRGVDVTLFDGGTRPPLVVGESLVPAIVPFLQALGVEEEVASYATYKPGASFVFDLEDSLSFRFDEVPDAAVAYAYNVPRDRFDRTLREAAVAAGARFVAANARVERAAGERVRLAPASLEAAGLRRAPDFIVDAAGRGRLLARALDLPRREGDRRDTALHAHLEGVPLLREGNVHTDRLRHGWCWRIPLPGRVSVGLVVDPAVLAEYGHGAEEQFDACLRHDPVLRSWGCTAKRLTPVMKYTNYQARCERGVGPGWALAGDAFGFVDPVFSSGLLLGMDGAWALAQALFDGSERALRRYERRVLHHLSTWQRLVGYFYDGRLFTLFKVGEVQAQRFPGRLLDAHFRRHLPRIFTGEATRSRYSVGLLDFMVRYALTGEDPRQLAVH